MDYYTALIIGGVLNAVIVAAATIVSTMAIKKSSDREMRIKEVSRILKHLSNNAVVLLCLPIFLTWVLSIGIKLLWGAAISNVISGVLLITYAVLGIFIVFFYLYAVFVLGVDVEK